MGHAPGHPGHTALSPRVQGPGTWEMPFSSSLISPPCPGLDSPIPQPRSAGKRWHPEHHCHQLGGRQPVSPVLWGGERVEGGAGRALGFEGTNLELLGPQEAQYSEAEKWLPAQLHPLPGLLPHDADCPALLQVGPRTRCGPRRPGRHSPQVNVGIHDGAVIFSCLGHASLVLLSGDMDMVGQVYRWTLPTRGRAGCTCREVVGGPAAG